jgi:sugar/nucleoside kinase (ribokinase family)
MGKITMLDTAWDSAGQWMKKLEPAMPYIDYFMPSVEEAEKLSGETEHKKIADAFFDMGAKHVVIKLGKNGCYLRGAKASEGEYFPTYSNVRPEDTTGAGDSFCAGFLFGLSKKYPLGECCRIGNAVGSHCVMKTGATAGIVPFEQIKKFMEEQEKYI